MIHSIIIMKNIVKSLRYYFAHNLTRKAFGFIQQKDIEHFKSIMNHNQVITDHDFIEPYNLDFRKNYRGNS